MAVGMSFAGFQASWLGWWRWWWRWWLWRWWWRFNAVTLLSTTIVVMTSWTVVCTMSIVFTRLLAGTNSLKQHNRNEQ